MKLKYTDAEERNRVATGKAYKGKTIWQGVYISGKDNKRTNITAKTVEEANVKVKLAVNDYVRGRDLAINVVTVNELVAFHIETNSFRYANGTVRRWVRTANYIDKYMGKRKYKDIKAYHIQKMLDEITKKAIEARKEQEKNPDLKLNDRADCADRVKSLLKESYDTIIQNGYNAHNPVTFTKAIKAEDLMLEKNKKLDIYNVEELKKWLAYVYEDISSLKPYTLFREKRDRAVIFMLMATGARIGEVLALKWEDIDLEKGVINIRGTLERGTNEVKRTKTINGTRKAQIMLDTHFLKEFKRLGVKMAKDERKPKPIFLTQTVEGAKSDSSSITRKARNEAERIGVTWLGFHSFRRTFITDMRKNGVRDTLIAKQVGHGNSSMLDTYTYENSEDIRQHWKDKEI